MTTLLRIDSSARQGASGTVPQGSHTRRLTARFVAGWLGRHPGTRVIHRDLGLQMPAPISSDWIQAAFTGPSSREPWMQAVLQTSDELVEELLQADVIVAGVPMYNFAPPAPFKSYIDNVVRVGRTFGFDRSRSGEPYWPLLAEQGKRLVILSSRGDYGYGPGSRSENLNHVEPSIRTAFAFMGITDVYAAAIEYDEFSDARLAASIAAAEAEVDRLVAQLAR